MLLLSARRPTPAPIGVCVRFGVACAHTLRKLLSRRDPMAPMRTPAPPKRYYVNIYRRTFVHRRRSCPLAGARTCQTELSIATALRRVCVCVMSHTAGCSCNRGRAHTKVCCDIAGAVVSMQRCQLQCI